MDSHIEKNTVAIQFLAACFLLIGALLFASPIHAASSPRELNQVVPTVSHTQVAWFFYRTWRPYRFYAPYRYYYRPFYRGYRYYRW